MPEMLFPSLLKREESTAIKGLLILLVVLGHNSILMESTGLFPYLYSFHVYCFYIFPFLYGFTLKRTNENTFHIILGRQIRNWRSYGIIYLFWCLLGVAVCVVIKHVSFQPWRSIWAIVWGHQTLLTNYCGFSFLWFLPTILAVMFWRDIYFVLVQTGKVFMSLCCISLWGLAVFGLGESHSLGMWCPLALIQGIFFSMSGIAVRFIVEQLQHKNGEICRYLFLLAPLIPLYVYFRRYLPEGCIYLTWCCCPVIAFLSLYSIKDFLCKNKFLCFVGTYSLQIYLLHTIIYNSLLFFVNKHSIAVGLIMYLLTLLSCAVLIALINKLAMIRFTIFPCKKGA